MNRIDEQREKGVLQKELAKILDISCRAVGMYEKWIN